MHTLVVLTLLATSCSLCTATPSTSAPQSLQDISHRLNMILNNTRSRENYIRCFMDRGICNKEALNIKHILTEALSANCTNCTDAQRLGAERFFEYLQTHQPETWVSLTGKYGGKRGHDHDDSDSESDEEDEDDDDNMKGNHFRGSGPHWKGANGTSEMSNSSTTPTVN